jgi:serine/threonine protein phosphatase PrpC
MSGFKLTGGQHQGDRSNQEDSWLTFQLECLYGAFDVAVVADGLGGHHGGEVASQEAVQRMPYFFEELVEDADWEYLVKGCGDMLHPKWDLLQKARPLSRGSTTFLMGVFPSWEATAHMFWLGDSVAHHFQWSRNAKMLVRVNSLRPEGHGNIVYRSMPRETRPQYARWALGPGDQVLLQTDGLDPLWDQATLFGECNHQPKGRRLDLDSLLDWAYALGPKNRCDNATGIVIEVLED